MKSNVKNRIADANKPRVAMLKYNIRAELAKIGIRMDEWLQEEIVLTDEQEAALRGKKP